MNQKRSLLERQRLYITDGGLETTLVFHHGIDLPHFAAFSLLNNQEGYAILREYYDQYARLAYRYKTNFILESPTWRASKDWGHLMGLDAISLDHMNRQSIDLMRSVKMSFEQEGSAFLISGCIGPRGDGYTIESKMTALEAKQYHLAQATSFAKAQVDMITGVTINYLEEGLGIAEAAAAVDHPSVISFTVETDGRLPSGDSLVSAIQTIDEEASVPPAYYMVNCAHPTHFAHLFDGASWLERVQGIRANASCKSHAELDEATELDEGDPRELGLDYVKLIQKLPNLQVVGGCCGTDLRHVEAMCKQILDSKIGAV